MTSGIAALPFASAVIALDAMGGDEGPDMVIAGAALALERYPKLSFIIYGDESKVSPILRRYPALAGASELRHTSESISPCMKPSLALRQGRQSSMRLAINAVAKGEACSVVSAGNTGALMAMAKFVLKTMPGIDRPAIATVFPTQKGECVVLDLGANLECDAENLVQFALMGGIFCHAVLGVQNPSIGLLNIGVEEMKGHDEVRTAASILRERPLPGTFCGYVEGNDIMSGNVDVIVTDGFSGNIALKTAEGTAKMIIQMLRQTFQSSLMAKIGYLFARGSLKKMRLRADPRRYNGAMFLGLQGVCVKSHGGTDPEGFANAIGVAHDLVAHRFNERIGQELAVHYGAAESEETSLTVENATVGGDV
ncbi:MAG: phosphate acyltransferase PlsX [Alphaproteobacteria bacterium]|nr:phosphate acyltransferase PlsX [Alphaproteobacteria bacterium]